MVRTQGVPRPILLDCSWLLTLAMAVPALSFGQKRTSSGVTVRIETFERRDNFVGTRSRRGVALGFVCVVIGFEWRQPFERHGRVLEAGCMRWKHGVETWQWPRVLVTTFLTGLMHGGESESGTGNSRGTQSVILSKLPFICEG